ncbi:MAG TPA: hypothetical protein VG204_04205 [Terriglobia bacterium]|nr:hypothetical protein [Terriglobia bacterium]
MSTRKDPKPLPVDVHEALEAICAHGHGRCWYCDARLRASGRALRGWDVQRIEEQPVASIILVCPKCARRKARLGDAEFKRRIDLGIATTRRLRAQHGVTGAAGAGASATPTSHQ